MDNSTHNYQFCNENTTFTIHTDDLDLTERMNYICPNDLYNTNTTWTTTKESNNEISSN